MSRNVTPLFLIIKLKTQVKEKLTETIISLKSRFPYKHLQHLHTTNLQQQIRLKENYFNGNQITFTLST